MATLTLRNEDIRALEQARQRFVQLTTSLQTLQASLLQSDPLPPWSSFQSQVKIVSQHIETLSSTLSSNDELLSRLAVFPLPEFPGRTQEGLLGQLLRKKLEPGVEDWIQDGLHTGNEITTTNSGNQIDRVELEELWDWAPVALQDELRQYLPVLGENYTLEERALGIENVVTGLNRELPDTTADSSDEDEDDSDEDAMKEDVTAKVKPEKVAGGAAQPSVTLNDQLKFMATGFLPASSAIGVQR